jgi:MFS family permease
MECQARSCVQTGATVVAPRPPIPPAIKRNTLLLAVTQAFVGVGNQMVPALGAIMVLQLLGSPALAGIATGILGGCRFLVAYPIGALTDRYGRRVGLVLGLVVSLVGVLAIGWSMAGASFPVFLLGLVLFGLGVGAGQQLRVAAADMYPPSRRAAGLGYVLMGALVGALGGSLLITLAEAWSPRLRLDPLALSWWLVPGVLLPSLGLVRLIRPDPKEIAANLSVYYPGFPGASPVCPGTGARVSVRRLLQSYPQRVACVTSFALHGNMAMIMAMTALALTHAGHALPAISFAVATHVIGMFGLSLPPGLPRRLARSTLRHAGWGRRGGRWLPLRVALVCLLGGHRRHLPGRSRLVLYAYRRGRPICRHDTAAGTRPRARRPRGPDGDSLDRAAPARGAAGSAGRAGVARRRERGAAVRAADLLAGTARAQSGDL